MPKRSKPIPIRLGFRGSPQQLFVVLEYPNGTRAEEVFDPGNPLHLAILKHALTEDPPTPAERRKRQGQKSAFGDGTAVASQKRLF
jgi:hypothetical protein